MEPVYQSQDDAISRLALDAYTFGGTEQSRLFGLDASARGQDFAEYGQFFGNQGFTPSPPINSGGANGVDIMGYEAGRLGSEVAQRQAQAGAQSRGKQQGFGALTNLSGVVGGLF